MLLLHRRYARALAIGVLAAFCVVILHAMLSGATSCGCFGSVKISPWVVLGVDVVLLAGALFLPRAKRIPDISTSRWLVITALSALAIGAVFAGVHRGYQGRYSTAQTLDLYRWQGQPWDRLAIFNFTPRAPDGRSYSPATFPEDRQTWVFYRRTCPHCRRRSRSRSANRCGGCGFWWQRTTPSTSGWRCASSRRRGMRLLSPAMAPRRSKRCARTTTTSC